MTQTFAEIGKNFLDHHGVKGMRWGVRKKRTAAVEPAKKVVGKTKTDNEGGSQAMSDRRLKQVINRMNMEKQYKELTKPPPSKAQKIEKFLGDIALNIAKTQITNVANQQIGQLLGTKSGGTTLKDIWKKRQKGKSPRPLPPPKPGASPYI